MSSAERFADLLERDPSSAAAGSAPAELTELASLTAALAAIPAPRMDPAADAAIRRRLVAVATVTPAAATPSRRRRLAALGIGAVTALTALTGVATAASRSLPGEPFYGLKLFTENVQLHLAGNDAAKGHRELEFAATRLSELDAVGITSPHAAALLASMRAETASGDSDLTSAARSEGSTAPLREFDGFARTQLARLDAVAAGAPAALRAQLHASTEQLLTLDRRAHSLAAILPATPTAPIPPPGRSQPPVAPPHASPRIQGSTGPSSHPVGSSAPTAPQPSAGRVSPPSRPTHHHLLPSLPLPLPTGAPTAPTSILPSVVTSLLGNLPGMHHHR